MTQRLRFRVIGPHGWDSWPQSSWTFRTFEEAKEFAKQRASERAGDYDVVEYRGTARPADTPVEWTEPEMEAYL